MTPPRLVFLALFAVAATADGATTRILDTMRDSNSALVNATCAITWPGFRAADGTSVSAGARRYTVRSGVVDIVLQATAGGTPTSAPWLAPAYTVRCGTAATEYWQVPVSATAVALAGVRQGAPGAASGSGVPSSVTTTNSGPGGPKLLKEGTGLSTITGRQLLPGEGIVLTQQTDTVTAEVDTAVVPRYAIGTVAPTGACQTGRDSYIRTGGTQEMYVCIGSAWVRTWQAAGAAPALITITDCAIMQSCSYVNANARTTVPSQMRAGNVVMIRVMIAGSLALKRAKTTVFGASSSGEAFAMAVYADSNGVPGAKISDTDLNATGFVASQVYSFAWGGGTATISGTVWIGFSTESATAQWQFTGGNFYSLPSITAGGSKPGLITCSNTATGSSTSYTLPSTCGTPAAYTTYSAELPIIVASSQP